MPFIRYCTTLSRFHRLGEPLEDFHVFPCGRHRACQPLSGLFEHAVPLVYFPLFLTLLPSLSLLGTSDCGVVKNKWKNWSTRCKPSSYSLVYQQYRDTGTDPSPSSDRASTQGFGAAVTLIPAHNVISRFRDGVKSTRVDSP